jgi:DNA-binding Lrp family transcriptional regulator
MKTKSKHISEQSDSDEKRILVKLQKHSKHDINTIVEDCGFSRQKVQRIIAQLEKNKVIWGYTTVTDEKKQELLKYLLLVKRSMKKIDKETAKKIAYLQFDEEYIKHGIIIETSSYLHGEYDWMILFTAKNLRDAKKFSNLLVENYPAVIVKINLMQILHSSKTHYIMNPTPEALLDFL